MTTTLAQKMLFARLKLTGGKKCFIVHHMTVYIIRAGKTGPVKIGYTKDIRVRLNALRASNPEKLKILRTLDGQARLEKWFHEKFAEDHIEGEWFKFNPEMLTLDPPENLDSALTKEIIKRRTNNQTYREIGEALGVSRTTVLNKLKIAGRDDLRFREEIRPQMPSCHGAFWNVIDEIAEVLGVSENNRRVWRQRHIPHCWRLPILMEAKKRGIEIPQSAFEKAYVNPRPRNA